MKSWCEEADSDPFDKRRKERCRRLTASTAAKVVEILNQHLANPETDACPADPFSTETRSCITCHGKSGSMPTSAAKMDCAACHDFENQKHPD